MTETEQYNLPIEESFTQETTRLNINLLYSCMLKRIAKGFSSMDVSFLMGFSFDYVKLVEQNMMNSGFEMVSSRIYLDALSDTNTGGILFDDFEMEQVSKFNMVKTIFPEQIVYEVYELSADEETIRKLIFKLFEKNHQNKKAKENQTQKNSGYFIKGILELLFEGTYFLSPQEPADIFQRCQLISDSDLKPHQVREILYEMTTSKSFPKLKARDRKDGITFEKVFKLNNKIV